MNFQTIGHVRSFVYYLGLKVVVQQRKDIGGRKEDLSLQDALDAPKKRRRSDGGRKRKKIKLGRQKTRSQACAVLP